MIGQMWYNSKIFNNAIIKVMSCNHIVILLLFEISISTDSYQRLLMDTFRNQKIVCFSKRNHGAGMGRLQIKQNSDKNLTTWLRRMVATIEWVGNWCDGHEKTGSWNVWFALLSAVRSLFKFSCVI